MRGNAAPSKVLYQSLKRTDRQKLWNKALLYGETVDFKGNKMTPRERKYHHHKWMLKVANLVSKHQFTHFKIQQLIKCGKPAGQYIELLPMIERQIQTMIS